MLSDQKIDYKCPKCGRTLQLKLGEMKPGGSKKCSCGAVLNFDGGNISRTVRDFDNALKKLGKK